MADHARPAEPGEICAEAVPPDPPPPGTISEVGDRRLDKSSAEAGLGKGEAWVLPFENFGSVIDEECLIAPMRKTATADICPGRGTMRDQPPPSTGWLMDEHRMIADLNGV